MNKLKHFALTVLVALVSSLSASAYDFQYNGLYYKITTTWNSTQNTCEITYGPSGKGEFDDVSDYTLENVIVPEGVAYNGTRYIVTAIGNYAFANCKTIKTLIVEGNVTKIGEYAFYRCSNLTSVQLNESVKYIGKSAFCNDFEVSVFKMPGVEIISSMALGYLKKLKTLEIPACTRHFPADAIPYLQSLVEIKVSEDNPYFMSENGVLYTKDKKHIKHFPEASRLTEFSIPEGVEEIDTLCFFWSGLRKITVPNTVKKIRCRAFGSCVNLEEIDLGQSVEEMGEYATFQYCLKLKRVVIPNKVKRIGEYCFATVPALEEVVFGENVEYFSNYSIDLSGDRWNNIPYNEVYKNTVILSKREPENWKNLPGSRWIRRGFYGNGFDYIGSYYKPSKGKWYEPDNDFTGLYCIGDTLFAFSHNSKQTKPSEMKDYASKSDYKYNPNAEFYYHGECLAFDFSKSGAKASDFVGKKISGGELIGTPVSNIDECGLSCITIYTTPQIESARDGVKYNMNTYRVINFAYPADDGNGYPYYLVKPVIGERCKVTGTYNSSKGGFYDSSLDYTVKIRGAKNLVNYRTYTLEGIIRYITTESSYSGGYYVLDVTGDIYFDYEIDKQPTEEDLSVELNKQNSQATYQWYQLEKVSGCDVSVNVKPSYGWKYSYGSWTSNYENYNFKKEIEIEKGDTLCFDWEVIKGGTLDIYLHTSESTNYLWDSSNKTTIYYPSYYSNPKKGVYTKVMQVDGTASFGIYFNGKSSDGYAAIISNIVIKKKNKITQNIGFALAGAESYNLAEEQYIDGKSVYCVVTLPHGQKLVSDTIQTRENLIAKQPTALDLSVELCMPTNKATYQWYNGVDESVIPNATNYILKELDGMNVGDVVFCEITLPNGRVLRSERVTLNDYSFGASRTITYIVNGNIFLTEEYEIGSTITAPEPPAIDGYTFVRWENLPDVMPVNDLTVTAVYKENKCKIYNGSNVVINSRYTSLDIKPDAATAANALVFVDESINENVCENFVMKNADNNWWANNVVLTDAQPFYCPADVEAQTVNYVRNFTSTNLQALYLPYAMSYDDWKDKAKVSYINDVHQFDDDDDGEIDRTVLEFISVKSGDLAPNIPYLIKPFEKGEMTFTSSNKTLKATLSDGYIDCSSTRTLYTLKGTYQTRDDIYANGYYAMSGGTFKVADNAGVKLSPFRIFLSITNRYGSGSVPRAKKITIMVDGIEEDTADIDGITINGATPTASHNLQGVRVGEGYKGIVIRNGRKVLAR